MQATFLTPRSLNDPTRLMSEARFVKSSPILRDNAEIISETEVLIVSLP